MTMIYVVNASSLVSDGDVALMARACASQLRYHAAPAWALAPIPVVYLPARDAAAPGSYVITVMDDSDQAGTLGWHTEESGVIYGRVFARPVLEHGGAALSGPLSISSVMSHEVLETFCDPRVNLWADDGKGTLYAYESGDPVEGDSYPVTVSQHEVMVSNFVTPQWFDAQSAGPFDYMHKLVRPFSMTTGGYVTTMTEGRVNQHYGEQYQGWRKATKQSPLARTARRNVG